MKYVVDRFEEDMAILEGISTTMEIHRSVLPPKAKEGDCLTLLKDGSFVLDENATESRKERIGKMVDDLFD